MKWLIRALAFLALSQSAYAGSLAVTPGSGATVGAGSDGTNQIPATILCGASASATLYATCVNQAIVNGSGQLLTLSSQSGTWNLTNISGTISLPTGASTSALQTTGNTALTTINTTLGTPMQNSGGSVTANIGTVGTLATAANQTTGNTSLSTIATNTTGVATAANQEVTAAGTTATSAQGIQGVTGGVPVPISGSVTASFSQFAPNGNFATLAVGASSTRVALPAGGGATVGVYNIGANAAFVRLGNTSVTATGTEDQVAPGGFLCLAVGSNVDLAAIETAGTTTLNLSGGSGGCAGSGGGGGGSGAASDTTLSSTGTISTANVYGTGLTVQTWQNGTPVLTGTPTANSALSFSGFAGWNTGYLECTGGGTTGTNYFEVDRTSTTTTWKRLADWTGPATSQTINLAGAVAINVVAAQYASGTLACTLRVSVNYATPDSGNAPINGTQFADVSMTSATTTQVIAAVPGLPIYVTNWDEFVSNTASTAPAWTFVYGTGTNCGTGTTTLSLAARVLAANNGIVRAGGQGQQFTVPPGNALCVAVTTAPTGGSLGVDITYAQ